MEKSVPNIVIFASGSVTAVLCNRKDAFVLTRAERLGVPHYTFTASEFRNNTLIYKEERRKLTDVLHELGTDFIILAGFLLKVPEYLIEEWPERGFLLKVPEYLIAEWPERILNIHPALLPSYGGKGMYGDHVHQAVIAAGEKESGITIHIVDNQYDHGKTIYQARCTVTPEDTPETLFAKVHELERAYPEVIEGYISQL